MFFLNPSKDNIKLEISDICITWLKQDPYFIKQYHSISYYERIKLNDILRSSVLNVLNEAELNDYLLIRNYFLFSYASFNGKDHDFYYLTIMNFRVHNFNKSIENN